MALKPWYNVVFPREDLREGRPLDASEFAVHLDQVRDQRGPAVYWNPRQFFERTFLSENLAFLASQVARRLSGLQTETSAIFNLVTQFGGGKTHALTLLYHLAHHGPEADRWPGAQQILSRAGVSSMPHARVAVFAGTEFDSLKGRGGSDGSPLRKTPWGEIAFQLGGAEAFQVVAEHDERFIEPKGDVIRAFLPKDRPSLILMDEIMTYVSTYRRLGYHNALYNFVHSLSEVAKGEANVVLVASLPKSEFEYTAEDEADQQRFEKMLDRNGKAVMISAAAETSEIIRRRLFEWDLSAVSQSGRVLLPREALQTCQEYGDWVVDHRAHLPAWFPIDRARDEFANTYPFHPTVLLVFERKWRALPRFQQTRGVLRLLALWVAHAYQAGFKGAHRDPLIGLGAAPLDDPLFRSAAFEQLGGDPRLEGIVTTDIAGKPDAHAVRLDEDAIETVRKTRVHRKVANSIFFESNGGAVRAEATLPELRLDVAEPGVDVGSVETALEALTSTAYFLRAEGTRYRFDLKPNLNKIFSDRRASISAARVDEEVRARILAVFNKGGALKPLAFPETSNQIPDRAALTLVVVPPERSMAQRDQTLNWLDKLVREAGSSARTFKSALIFVVPDQSTALSDAGRNVLAWQAIQDEGLAGLDEADRKQLDQNLKKARNDLAEAVWRAYNHLVLLGKDNQLRVMDLGLVHSSAANSLVDYIVQDLTKFGELTEEISPNFLVRNWPPAFIEWSTKSVRDAFFASPQFMRLLNPDKLRDAIAKGVTNGFLAYVGKSGDGQYTPFIYGQPLSPADVEILPDMYIITKETAEKYKAARDAARVAPVAPAPEPADTEKDKPAAIGENGGAYKLGTVDPAPVADTPPRLDTTGVVKPPTPSAATPRSLRWTGPIPSQKWSQFYMRVLSKLVNAGALDTTVTLHFESEAGLPQQKIDEIRAALRELGLNDHVETGS